MTKTSVLLQDESHLQYGMLSEKKGGISGMMSHASLVLIFFGGRSKQLFIFFKLYILQNRIFICSKCLGAITTPDKDRQ